MEVRCTNCRRPYPQEGVPTRCGHCGGVYDFEGLPTLDRSGLLLESPGIWRYQLALGLPEGVPQVSLGEGNTPLVWTEAFGRRIALKCEFVNPTGSFKDRGSAPLVSFLLSRGVSQAVEDSSGNAGASFAAYAARAGIRAKIFVPDSASGPKRLQIQAYGAEVISILGPRSNAAEAVRRAAEQGAVYASHAFLPFNIWGYATAAYEITEQLGKAPGTVVVPVGQGGFLLGLARGFSALHQSGWIAEIPKLVGVQARACAPLWALFAYGALGLSLVSEGETVAEGIRNRHPVRGDAVLKAVELNTGLFVSVEEADILDGRDQLAHQGFYVEITSAVVWNAIGQIVGRVPEPIVAVLTGSGLKTPL